MRIAVPATAVVLLSIALPCGLWSSSAEAYSDIVRSACRGDYLTFCNSHEVGSPGLKACMRRAGAALQPSCVNALVKAGEISAHEVARMRSVAKR